MTDAVLDASVVLALLWAEPISDETRRLIELGDVSISAVNLAEVATKLADAGSDVPTLRGTLDTLELDVASFEGARAIATAGLRSATRHAGLSLGDRACLALAKELGVPALTTDRKWLDLNLGIEVRFARPGG